MARERIIRWALGGALTLALVLALVFAVRLTLSALYWNDPEHRDRPIEGWMPLGYVARSWQVPPESLAEVLGLVPGSQPRRNLDQIAQDLGLPLDVVIDRLVAAIVALREAGHD